MAAAASARGCDQPVILIEAAEEKVRQEFRRRQITHEEAQALRQLIVDVLRERNTEARFEVTRQKQRLHDLTDQRDKLLQAFYAGAVPLDQLKNEQERISRQTAAADRLVETSQVELDKVETGLKLTLDFAATCVERYENATPLIRDA